MDAWTTLWASWVAEQALPGTTGADRASVYFAGLAPSSPYLLFSYLSQIKPSFAVIRDT